MNSDTCVCLQVSFQYIAYTFCLRYIGVCVTVISPIKFHSCAQISFVVYFLFCNSQEYCSIGFPFEYGQLIQTLKFISQLIPESLTSIQMMYSRNCREFTWEKKWKKYFEIFLNRWVSFCIFMSDNWQNLLWSMESI